MTIRVGEAIKRGQRYVARPGAYAILFRAGQILLTHQAAPHNEFQLPGGGIDPGEQVIPALHREVLEETGWHISPPKRVGVFRRYAYMPDYDIWAEKIAKIYLARPTLRMGAPTEAGHTAHWVDPRLAVELLGNPGDALLLRRLMFSRGWSEF